MINKVYCNIFERFFFHICVDKIHILTSKGAYRPEKKIKLKFSDISTSSRYFEKKNSKEAELGITGYNWVWKVLFCKIIYQSGKI